jgi:signal transduction histidine kinase
MLAQTYLRFCLFSLSVAPLLLHAQTIDSLDRKIELATGLEKAEALNDAVLSYVRTNIQKAKELVDQAYAFSNSNKDPLIKAYALLNDGLYHSAKGIQDSAVSRIEKGQRIAEEKNYIPYLIRSNVALGRIYTSAGNPENALKSLYKTLNYLKTNPQPETEMKARVNIVFAYLELKRYRDCVSYGRKSIELLTPAFEYMLPYFCNNMAAAYGALKQIDSCQYFVLKGLPIAEGRKDYNLVANAYYILGNSYAESGDFNKAIEQFQKAKPYREKIGNQFFIVADLYVLSELYFKKGDYKSGIKSGLEGLALAEKYNLKLKFEGVYQALAKNYEALGDFKNASKYYSLLAAAKDSVYQHATADALADMQTKYETEKKEQQITLLNRENELKTATIQRDYFLIAGLATLVLLISLGFYIWHYRDQQKQKAVLQEQKVRMREAQMSAVIDSQEKERKRFAADLHDGMGQLISALQLNINSIQQDKSPERRDHLFENSEQILADIHTEIRNIAFNLMPPVLIKEGLMAGLAELFRRINKSGVITVSLSHHQIPDRFNEIGEISIYRVVQEIMSNLVKHSKATQATVDFTGHDDEVVLTIEDDGIGYSLEKFQNSEGNGWRNINSRLNLIKGSIEFDVVEGRKNNTIIITIPLQSLKISIPSLQENG